MVKPASFYTPRIAAQARLRGHLPMKEKWLAIVYSNSRTWVPIMSTNRLHGQRSLVASLSAEAAGARLLNNVTFYMILAFQQRMFVCQAAALQSASRSTGIGLIAGSMCEATVTTQTAHIYTQKISELI
ncbi:hypothetical protein EYR38_003629 [Pleurotus pulmonarius]|nr:hypothetical protein EYR38_003629 [Pleurotus pulmonarius]